MVPRLARIGRTNFNSVRYQPRSQSDDQALLASLTPDPNWYSNLKTEVGTLNRDAIAANGTGVNARTDYLLPVYNKAVSKYPDFDTPHLRQPALVSDVPIVHDPRLAGQSRVNGYYESDEDGIRIALNPNLSAGLQAKTAIHELAHHRLGHHDDANFDISQPIREFQAEAVARGVRSRLGIPSSNDQTASASYIAGYLTKLAGTGVTPGRLFADNEAVITAATQQLAPLKATPFKRMLPQLYSKLG